MFVVSGDERMKESPAISCLDLSGELGFRFRNAWPGGDDSAHKLSTGSLGDHIDYVICATHEHRKAGRMQLLRSDRRRGFARSSTIAIGGIPKLDHFQIYGRRCRNNNAPNDRNRISGTRLDSQRRYVHVFTFFSKLINV